MDIPNRLVLFKSTKDSIKKYTLKYTYVDKAAFNAKIDNPYRYIVKN